MLNRVRLAFIVTVLLLVVSRNGWMSSFAIPLHLEDSFVLPPSRSLKNSSSSSVLLIPSEPDSRVLEHLSYAWTEVNGTERLRVKEDPHLSRIRNGTCPPTSQLRLDTTTWILTSLDFSGQSKTVGGDEFYINYRNRDSKSRSPTAVAHALDQGDGTYQLDFVSSPFSSKATKATNGGSLTIHLEYTCGLGILPMPTKNEWRTGGAVMVSYKNLDVNVAPPIRDFVPPNVDASIDLGKYKRVVVYGDSNLNDLAQYNPDKNLKPTQKPDNPLVPGRPLNKFFLNKSHWFLNLTIQEEGANASIAIILGSATWDIVFGDRVGPNYKNHLSACTILINSIQREFPEVDIYWHSGYALQLHVSSSPGWYERGPLKYMSYSRSVELYELQIELMKRLDIPVLQFMEATYLASEFYGNSDSRHIHRVLAKKILGWYYPKNSSY